MFEFLQVASVNWASWFPVKKHFSLFTKISTANLSIWDSAGNSSGDQDEFQPGTLSVLLSDEL